MSISRFLQTLTQTSLLASVALAQNSDSSSNGQSSSDVTTSESEFIAEHQPRTLETISLTQWYSPDALNPTDRCSISPGKTTVVLVCDDKLQVIKDLTKGANISPVDLQSQTFHYKDIKGAFTNDPNSDLRQLQQNALYSQNINDAENIGEVIEDLVDSGTNYMVVSSFNPSTAEVGGSFEATPIVKFQSGLTDRVDWLVANETRGTLAYRANEFQQQMYMVFDTDTREIQDVGDSNYMSAQFAWNYSDQSMTQLDSRVPPDSGSSQEEWGKRLTRAQYFFDDQMSYNQQMIDVPAFAAVGNMEAISNIWNEWMAASDMETKIVIFRGNEVFAQVQIDPAHAQPSSYGYRMLLSSDRIGQPILAVVYQSAYDHSANAPSDQEQDQWWYVDLYKPLEIKDDKAMPIWHQKALKLKQEEVETLQIQQTGLLMWLNETGHTNTQAICTNLEYYQNGTCQTCPLGYGTIFMQQATCISCYELQHLVQSPGMHLYLHMFEKMQCQFGVSYKRSQLYPAHSEIAGLPIQRVSEDFLEELTEMKQQHFDDQEKHVKFGILLGAGVFVTLVITIPFALCICFCCECCETKRKIKQPQPNQSDQQQDDFDAIPDTVKDVNADNEAVPEHPTTQQHDHDPNKAQQQQLDQEIQSPQLVKEVERSENKDEILKDAQINFSSQNKNKRESRTSNSKEDLNNDSPVSNLDSKRNLTGNKPHKQNSVDKEPVATNDEKMLGAAKDDDLVEGEKDSDFKFKKSLDSSGSDSSIHSHKQQYKEVMQRIKGATQFNRNGDSNSKGQKRINSSRTSEASRGLDDDNAKDLFGDATDHPNAESSFSSEGF